jgi:thiol:disulfide interchange protein DsbD
MTKSKTWRLLLAIAVGVAIPLLPDVLAQGLGTADLSGKLGLASGVTPATFGILMLAGLLTAATPCVYPLIPITVSIFGARQAGNRGRAVALSATYVLGICATYSALGLFAALTGRAFGSALSSPIVVAVLAIFLFALSASMFGAFELQLPSGLQQRLTSIKGAGFLPALGMGLVAGFIAAPCTGPVLAGVLAYVAKTGSAVLGFWMLFAYAFGLGLPFLVLGSTSVKLPRSGPWMEGIKTVLGIALVATGVSLLRPLLPALPELSLSARSVALIAGVLAAAAVLVGAFALSFYGPAREKLQKGLALSLLLLAVGLRFGWLGAPKGGVSLFQAEGPAIAWLHDHETALAEARRSNKKLLVDFWATWCSACNELEEQTWTDAKVRREISERFVPLKVDVTADADQNKVAKRYGVQGFPTVLAMPCDEKAAAEPPKPTVVAECKAPGENNPGRIVGFIDAKEMLERLRKVE